MSPTQLSSCCKHHPWKTRLCCHELANVRLSKPSCRTLPNAIPRSRGGRTERQASLAIALSPPTCALTELTLVSSHSWPRSILISPISHGRVPLVMKMQPPANTSTSHHAISSHMVRSRVSTNCFQQNTDRSLSRKPSCLPSLRPTVYGCIYASNLGKISEPEENQRRRQQNPLDTCS